MPTFKQCYRRILQITKKPQVPGIALATYVQSLCLPSLTSSNYYLASREQNEPLGRLECPVKIVLQDFGQSWDSIIGRAKRAPHWGVQSRFRVVCRSVCMYVCLSWSKKRRRNYVGQTRACSKSVLCGKIRPLTPALLISTIRYSSFSMDGRETFT